MNLPGIDHSVKSVAAVLVCLVCLAAGASSPQPPPSLTDEGACPFECCTYREWSVEADTPLLARPDDRAPVIGKASKGTKAQGITGIVIVTNPGRIEVLRPYTSESGRRYKPGDIVWVYTERGEGFFTVWYRGEMYDEEATFMYHDRGGWDGCVEKGTCWGKRKSFPVSIWWVKVKSSDGTVGWSRAHRNFGNMDACG